MIGLGINLRHPFYNLKAVSWLSLITKRERKTNTLKKERESREKRACVQTHETVCDSQVHTKVMPNLLLPGVGKPLLHEVLAPTTKSALHLQGQFRNVATVVMAMTNLTIQTYLVLCFLEVSFGLRKTLLSFLQGLFSSSSSIFRLNSKAIS